jgi:hypothetical protein
VALGHDVLAQIIELAPSCANGSSPSRVKSIHTRSIAASTMNRVDEIVAELLANTGALGVWLLGAMVVANNQHQNEVLAGAVKDPSIKPPMKILVGSETYFDFVERQIFAEPIGQATLVFVFDDRSSLGLIRLRVRNAKDAIARGLAARRG